MTLRPLAHSRLPVVATGVLAAALIALYFLARAGSTAQTIGYEGIGVWPSLLASVESASIGRSTGLPLVVRVLPICFHLAGDAVLVVYDALETALRYPSIADFVYLGGYASIVVSMLLLVRRRERPVLSDVLDSVIVLVGSGLLFWFTLVEPIARGAGSTALSKVVYSAYPSADVLLVVAVSQLVLSTGTRSMSFRLIAIGASSCSEPTSSTVSSRSGACAPEAGWMRAG